MNYSKAKELFLKGDFKHSEPFFKESRMILEYGYCRMFSGDLDGARRLFSQIREENMRGDWAYLLIQFIKNYIQFMPSYLQIRNFLEIDIDFLIKAKRPDYVENVVNCADLFYEVNQESYKFIARVLMNNNFPTVAKIFLDKGCEKCYNDPELHFIYGNYHLQNKNTLLAINEFETSNEVLPGYYPAEMMLKKLR